MRLNLVLAAAALCGGVAAFFFFSPKEAIKVGPSSGDLLITKVDKLVEAGDIKLAYETLNKELFGLKDSGNPKLLIMYRDLKLVTQTPQAVLSPKGWNRRKYNQLKNKGILPNGQKLSYGTLIKQIANQVLTKANERSRKEYAEAKERNDAILKMMLTTPPKKENRSFNRGKPRGKGNKLNKLQESPKIP